MRPLRSGLAALSLLTLLTACGADPLYLVKPAAVSDTGDIPRQCLSLALSDESSQKPFPEEDRELLNGVNTVNFLYWGSLQGPRPVVREDGSPSEAACMTAITDSYKILLAERYVACLLKNGYSWPEEEWVRARFRPDDQDK